MQYVLDMGFLDTGLTRALVDTGSCSTIIDETLAKACGLPYTQSVPAEWGTYQGTGGEPQAYAGVVKGPVKVALSKEVEVTLPFIREFKHKYPLALLGADVLKPLMPKGRWWYSGMANDIKEGMVTSKLLFTKDDKTESVPCVAFPGSMGQPAVAAGQCL